MTLIQDYYRSRSMNAQNPFQGNRKKVLCVCSAGLLRSPTLAWVLSNEPFGFNTRAAGSQASYALIPVDQALIDWADLIIFVNEANTNDVLNNFDLSRKEYRTLAIPDNFEFRDPELVRIINEQLKELFK